MFWNFVIPLAVVLIFILRTQFPEARRSFQSSLLLLSFAMILQFQNCSNVQDIRTNPHEAVLPSEN